jgi:phenylacetate-CoA ligase
MNNSHPITAFVSAITGVRTIARLKLREQSRATKLRQWQEVRLRRLLHYAYREVPYYHQSFDDASMRPGDIRSIDELRSLPVLTRENVLTHADELVSQEAAARKRSSLIPIRTTGSSGIPLQVWLSQREYFQSLSHVLYGFLSAGASITDTFVHIHVPLNKAQHFTFERLGILQQVHLDLRMGEHSTLAELRQLDAPVVYSFPSYLLLMANVVLE